MNFDRDLIKKELKEDYYPAFLMLKKAINKFAENFKVEDLKKDEQNSTLKQPKQPIMNPKDKSAYHIYSGKFRLTDEPVSLTQVLNNYGSVQRLESLGYLLKPLEEEKQKKPSLPPPKPSMLAQKSEDLDKSDAKYKGKEGNLHIYEIDGHHIEINKMVDPKGHWMAQHRQSHQDIGHGTTREGALNDAVNTLRMHGVIKKKNKVQKSELIDNLEELAKAYGSNFFSGRRRRSLREINKRPKRGIVRKEELNKEAGVPPATQPKQPPQPKQSLQPKQPKSFKDMGKRLKGIKDLGQAMNQTPANPSMAPSQKPKKMSFSSNPSMIKSEVDQDFAPKFYKKEAKLDKEHSEKIVQKETKAISQMIKDELKEDYKPKFKIPANKVIKPEDKKS